MLTSLSGGIEWTVPLWVCIVTLGAALVLPPSVAVPCRSPCGWKWSPACTSSNASGVARSLFGA